MEPSYIHTYVDQVLCTYPRIRFELGGFEYRRVFHVINRVRDVPRGDQFGVRELDCAKPAGKYVG